MGQSRDTGSNSTTLLAARAVAGLLGLVQLAGATYFLLIARDEAVWLGPAADIPVVGIMLVGFALKLAVAFWPRVPAARRIALGLAAVAIGVVVTLIKIPLYDAPEGAVFLAADGVLLALLLLARRDAASVAAVTRAPSRVDA